MAAAEFVSGMDDCRLKPPMLRSVIRDRLPDEKRSFPSPAEFAAVLSNVQTHGLLSERHSDTADRKLVEAWRSAVDSWSERIISLASSSVTDECWAGSCLLGVTCQECCSDRFQSSYSVWFQKLLENIQSPSAINFIKVPCCASLGDLFTRLACFPNLKKDGTLLARKTIKPVLLMLNEDVEETCWDVSANLLCTLISLFPSSIQQHYDNVEAVLTKKVMAAKCNLNTSKKISCSLAMLPKVKGDADNWCLIIQKILIAINSILSDAFQGLEEENKSSKVMKKIVPPGKDPPPLLGGQALFGEASEPATKRLSEFLVPRVTSLMYSCRIMLTNPCLFQVPVPVCPLLATVERVLQVDGSFRESLFPLTTSMHQELLCAELPALHLGTLDLLIAIIKSLRSQLFVHGANVVRLLTEYFRRARLPSIRKKVYSIAQMLLISMGVGRSLYLAQEVINNARADLTNNLTDNLELESSPKEEPFQQKNYHKKRKRASIISVQNPNGVDLRIKACSMKPQSPLPVKIAALKALETLLTMGGHLGSEHWRSDVDCLVITVATNACDEGWANEVKPSLLEDDESSFVDFQLAALEVLLASLLSPTRTRPPHLSRGLGLFKIGSQETGSKIATFCDRALLALEVLMRPRSSPLVDHPPPKNLSADEKFNQFFAGNSFNNGVKIISKGDLGLLDELDEELSSGWFDNNGTANKLSNSTEDITRKPSVLEHETTVDEEKTEEFRPGNSSLEKMDFEEELSVISVTEIRPGRSEASKLAAMADMSSHGSEAPKLAAMADMSSHGSEAPKLSSMAVIKEDYTAERLPDLYKEKDAVLSYDSDSVSLDSLPDIVDGDPDSD